MNKQKSQKIAGIRAAATRKRNAIDRKVQEGSVPKMSGAAMKAHVTRTMNAQIAAV